MIIQKVKPEEFAQDALDSFDRHQVVRNVYREIDGQLTLVLNPFEEDWSIERRREKAAEIRSGKYIVIGAFDADRIVGQIMLLPELNQDRMIVDSFHVSKEYRRKGIGRALFAEAKKEAKQHGAKALYISACSSQETIDFYLSMGCEVSRNPIEEYAKDEPCDIQMECILQAPKL